MSTTSNKIGHEVHESVEGEIVEDLIARFVDTVNEYSKNGKKVLTQQERKEVFEQYKELYERFERVELKELKDLTDEKTLQCLKVLGVGLEHAQKLHAVWNLVSAQSDKTLTAVAQFVKSSEGFDLIHKNTLPDQMALEKLFGSILGAKIASDSMSALKTEKIADIIGYALSGLCEIDYEQGAGFEAFQKENPKGTLGDFFREKMYAHKVNMGVYRSQSSGANYVDVYARVAPINSRMDEKIASANMVDSCFIVKPVDPVVENGAVVKVGRKGKIVFGLATSNEDTADQEQQFLKTYQALEQLVKNNQEYKDYELEPFYVLGGRLRFSRGKSDEYKGMRFEKLLKDIRQQECNDLQQSHYYGLF